MILEQSLPPPKPTTQFLFRVLKNLRISSSIPRLNLPPPSYSHFHPPRWLEGGGSTREGGPLPAFRPWYIRPIVFTVTCSFLTPGPLQGPQKMSSLSPIALGFFPPKTCSRLNETSRHPNRVRSLFSPTYAFLGRLANESGGGQGWMKRLGRGNLPFTHTQSKREKKGRALREREGKQG